MTYNWVALDPTKHRKQNLDWDIGGVPSPNLLLIAPQGQSDSSKTDKETPPKPCHAKGTACWHPPSKEPHSWRLRCHAGFSSWSLHMVALPHKSRPVEVHATEWQEMVRPEWSKISQTDSSALIVLRNQGPAHGPKNFLHLKPSCPWNVQA